MCSCTVAQSPKFKRVSLMETPEFPFWCLNICVDFDLGDFKIMENIKKLNKIIFHYKIFISTKLPNPIHATRVSKLVFIAIPCPALNL